jgi:hypothetical protein
MGEHRGMPQTISWMPCICEPAREAGRQGRGMGHLTLWCGTCSTEDHRGYPVLRTGASGQLQRSGQRVDDATGCLSTSETTARATATAAGWFAATTVTMLMIWLACARSRCWQLWLMPLPGRHGELGRVRVVATFPVDGDGDVVAAG